tara:strand:- start:333 stop:1364 length:1032 start_codon:yes stop_codon:yes gene_type:complete
MSEETTEIQQDANPIDDSSVNPISEGVTASNDSDDDAVLDQIMGSGEPEASVAEAEDEGTPVPEPEVAAKAETELDTETRGEPGEDYHRAMAALQRDGTPREVLDYMYDQDPDGFTTWGLKREKVQRDGDRFGDEHSKLKERLEYFESGDGQPTTTDESEGQPPQEGVSESAPTSVVHKTFEKSMADISEIFGEEAAGVIMSPIQAMSQALGTAIQQIQALTGYAEAKEMEVARGSLRERFPQLDTEDAYGQVVERMRTLHKSGDYNDIRSLMTDAARILYADAAPPRDAASENKAKSRGQPTIASKTMTGKKSLTQEDREDAALDAIFDGGGLDGAKDAYTV